MRKTEDGVRYLVLEEGHHIYQAAKRLSPPLDKGQLARRVSPETTDPARHLRAVLSGRSPLTETYEYQIAEALGCDMARLRRIMSGSDELSATQFPSFTTVEPLDLSFDWKADSFYNGSRPAWEDLEAEFDISRVAYTKTTGLQSRLKELVESKAGLQALAIVGAGGVGKSTLLRRAAYDAAKDGLLVLRLNADWSLSGESVVSQLRRASKSTTRSVVVVIDDLSDICNNSSSGIEFTRTHPKTLLSSITAQPSWIMARKF